MKGKLYRYYTLPTCELFDAYCVTVKIRWHGDKMDYIDIRDLSNYLFDLDLEDEGHIDILREIIRQAEEQEASYDKS